MRACSDILNYNDGFTASLHYLSPKEALLSWMNPPDESPSLSRAHMDTRSWSHKPNLHKVLVCPFPLFTLTSPDLKAIAWLRVL